MLSVEIYFNNLLTFSVTMTFYQIWFHRDGNVVFCSLIFFIDSEYFRSSNVLRLMLWCRVLWEFGFQYFEFQFVLGSTFKYIPNDLPFHIIIIIILFIESFSHQLTLMVFRWSVCDSKFPRVSRTHLSILADLNNAVVWTVSTRPVISKYSSPCTNPLVTVPRAPITISIIVAFMFHSFSIPKQGRSTYTTFRILSILLCDPRGQQSNNHASSLFFYYY